MNPDELEKRIREMRSQGQLGQQQQKVRIAALQIHKIPFDLNLDEQFIEIPAGLQVVSAEFEVATFLNQHLVNVPYATFNIVGLSAPINSQEPSQSAMMRVAKLTPLEEQKGTLTHFREQFAPELQRVASCHLPDGTISYYVIGDMPKLA